MKKLVITLAAGLILGLSQGAMAQTQAGQMPQIAAQSTQTQALSARQTALAQLGAYTAKGDLKGLATAVNAALDQGMTVNEIKDVMVQLYAYAGFPRSLHGLGTVDAVVKERRAQGKKTEMGRAAQRPAGYQAAVNGKRTQTELVGQAVDITAVSPDIDRYLKEHLFGDIFASNLLTWQEREIVTLAALANISGTQSEQAFHTAVGLRHGLSQAQVEAAKNIITPWVNSPYDPGKENIEYAQFFTGKTYLNNLSGKDLTMFNTTFAPAARNFWHIHRADEAGGQILIVTAGRGYYQEWGKPAQELNPGDVVHIPANLKHWHGAAPNEWFQHIAIEVPGKNAKVEWLEEVSEADYGKLK